jgi:hypothetical protein
MKCFRVFVIPFLLLLPAIALTQTIGTFNSVQPTGQTEMLVLPSTHRFQRIIRTGDPLPAGGQLGGNLDFTGYVPIGGSSSNGYLSISSETVPAETTVLTIAYNAGTKTWSYTDGGKVNYPVSEIGNVARFCSGTVTPKNTIMVGEESVAAGDANGDGYEDIGWVIEIDPATRTVINQDGIAGADKLWALGRQAHENVSIKSDESVIYWGADATPTGYMYKFVPTTAGDYTTGSLYVLQTTTSLGTGNWVLVNNSSQLDRNNTVALSTAAGAYNFDGIEDVEIGPDNKVYFAAKGPGVVYRFRDLGATVNQLEVFVSSSSFDVDGAGPFAPEPWGVGNDNLAFDGEGNLWVLQDGSRNHIWVVAPSHSASSNAVRLFATTPLGSEPTGITFSPDYKFLFMSFQHPFATNTAAQTDAANQSVVFNTNTTVVIARREFLGASSLPVKFSSFEVKEKNEAVQISWTVEQISNHHYFEVERSVDGIHFEAITNIDQNIDSRQSASFQFTDDNLPVSSFLHYRIRQCDKDGSCSYSVTRLVRNSQVRKIKLYPLPAKNTLHVSYSSAVTEDISLYVVNAGGSMLHTERRTTVKGMNEITVHVNIMKAGQYFLVIKSATGKSSFPFTKMN